MSRWASLPTGAAIAGAAGAFLSGLAGLPRCAALPSLAGFPAGTVCLAAVLGCISLPTGAAIAGAAGAFLSGLAGLPRCAALPSLAGFPARTVCLAAVL
ncbi:hypothetical protein [Mycobacteroides abscessus]|uniref:hypothetical protein n=1 Tax=Mycobacteroides abscessus TaxID=36809 RepID=UPI0009A7A634|nr:hypothetical protein [Mycobacteroides abscessus]